MELRFNVGADEFTIETAPPALPRVRSGVAVLRVAAPMLPEPEINESEAVPVMVPVLVIEPDPLALRKTVFPVTPAAAMEIAPLLAVVLNVKEPVEASPVVELSPWLLETSKPLKVELEERLNPAAVVLATRALPVVSTLKTGVEVRTSIFPPVELNERVVPVSAAFELIWPTPCAVKVTAVPLIALLPKFRLPLLAVVVRLMVPAELIAFETVIVVSADTERLAKVLPPFCKLSAGLEATIVTAPVVSKNRLEAEMFKLPMFPDPDFNERRVAEEIVPEACVIEPDP